MKKFTLHDHVRLHSWLFLGGAAITVIGGYLSSFENHHPLLWIGIAVLLICAAHRLIAIKCPHCGSSLIQCKSFPEFCPDCGERL